MPRNHTPNLSTISTIARLAEPTLVQSLNPIAARFLHSLRLIAIHQRARRDPVPELAARLSSVHVAAKALALSQIVSAVWPENIHVSRFCCCRTTHDEATIASMIEGACNRDRAQFDHAGEGFIRPDRMDRLWAGVLELVEAELTAC
ncbi:DNA-directed RNA polymerase subunit beta' [Qipengyuania sp. S6317L1]|uniref:DNA-directed RNA polymerase subunit beta' n=1 Tax=Qipengyuania sp. S6317L1 TaxID=2926410 RepID=UPI001FF2F279|nr:DNA-directed RNA polymerase subunit beta' [Qipengyuania sp. S6317L1]MCK0098807.1 DNA-directed RNA polymerase subunit beta' [Qipengyuania sp. S6317L1]